MKLKEKDVQLLIDVTSAHMIINIQFTENNNPKDKKWKGNVDERLTEDNNRFL